MRKNSIKYLALFTSLVLLFSLSLGCSKNSGDENVDSHQDQISNRDNSKEDSTNNNSSKDDSKIDSVYPIVEEKITLTCWAPFTSTVIQSLSENLAFQKLEEITNIKIDFKHPPAGEAQQNFNLMISSNKLTDIIMNPSAYSGGPDKAVIDGYYLKLNDYIDKYAPNYKKWMNYNEEIRRQCITDEGNIWAFSCIQLDEEPPWSGPMIRKDWLDDLGLDMPKTIDDWDNVLRQFKTIDGCEAPLVLEMSWRWESNSAFTSAFGASLGGNNNQFLNKDGKVVYGPIEPGYKDFLILMNKWYKDKLLDNDFATRDTQSIDAYLSTGKAGAYVSGYGDFSKYNLSGKDSDPDFEMVPAPYPVLNEGDELHIRQTNPYVRNYYTVITTDCEYPVEAVKWADYFYSDEGYLLMNYGVEDVTYELQEGNVEFGETFIPESIRGKKPIFTEVMTNDPDGIDFWTIMHKYKNHCQSGYLRNPLAYEMSPAALDSMQIWGEAGNDWFMPPVVLTAEENEEYSKIMTEVDAYREEMTFKFIMGLESIENFDIYVNQMKALGIDRVLEIQQNALERYMNR